jgi:hypothetical protein
VARGPEPRFLAELSSGVTTCSSDPDLASLSSWAPALTHVSWLWALPPREESFGAVTCSSAPDPASLSRWAPALPRGSGLTSLRGELRCCHVPHGLQQAVDHRNKEGHNYPGMQLGSHVSKARSRVTETPARRADMRYSPIQQCNIVPADHSWTWLQW